MKTHILRLYLFKFVIFSFCLIVSFFLSWFKRIFFLFYISSYAFLFSFKFFKLIFQVTVLWIWIRLFRHFGFEIFQRCDLFLQLWLCTFLFLALSFSLLQRFLFFLEFPKWIQLYFWALATSWFSCSKDPTLSLLLKEAHALSQFWSSSFKLAISGSLLLLISSSTLFSMLVS